MPDEKGKHLRDLFEYQVIERLDKLHDNYAAVSSSLSAMSVVQSKQEENLREHMKRTDIIEGEVRRIEAEQHDDNKAIRTEFSSSLSPITAHVNRLQGAWKLIASASGMVIVATLSYKAFVYLSTITSAWFGK